MKLSKANVILALGLLLVLGHSLSSETDEGYIAYQNGDFDKAALIWEEKAQNGDPNAAYNLGSLKTIQGDSKNAIKWLAVASDFGIPQAQFNLGVLYEHGIGTKVDLERAFILYGKASKQNYLEAQNNLAALYYDGRGTEKNIVKALYWLKLAATNGFAESQYALGNFYKNGTTITKNIPQAIMWLTKSAEQGNSNAQYLLSAMYYNGIETEKNCEKAKYWVSKASDQGHEKAKKYIWKMRFRCLFN